MPGEVKLKLIVKLYNSYKVWVYIKTAAVSETIIIILALFDTVLWQLCLSPLFDVTPFNCTFTVAVEPLISDHRWAGPRSERKKMLNNSRSKKIPSKSNKD